ncbi:MAG: TonB-dependent receptor [Luteitalea sp.]|nr:TonB-dependent receptor [Luteitalea sp.]
MASTRHSLFHLAAFLLLLGPLPVSAQEASGIAGVARDPSGAVLPGVTVEAASPVLIEKVRTAITDGEGRYNIIDLRPGVYTVTFSLPGFSTVRREGVELSAGFTATVNGDLRVGSLEETITVSGAAPLVDTQNVRKQIVANRELLDALPTSTKHVNTLVTLTPGFTGVTDVGGRYAAEPGSYHGKRGIKVYFDGMGVENSDGNSSYQINAAVVEEMVLQTSGVSAEINADGPVMNVVPKEGGNIFRFIANGLYTDHHLESDNLTDELRARGLVNPNTTVKIFDEAASLGGAIKKDKLWFFGAIRTWGMARQFAGVTWNKTQNELLTPPGAAIEVVKLTPWIDRPLDRLSSRWEWYDTYLGRLTWQATPKHKFNLLSDNQTACNCGSVTSASLQEVSNGYRFEPNRFLQGTYSSPLTGRLLLEAGVGASVSQWNHFWQTGVQAGTASITDVGLGRTYGAAATYRAHPGYGDRYMVRGSMTYVTGSHTFKIGVQREHLVSDIFLHANGTNVQYTFRNEVPISILQRTTPYLTLERTDDLGLYAQDQWRFNKFTFNYGLRFDYVNGHVPAQEIPAVPDDKFFDRFPGVPLSNPWVGERRFDRVNGVPSWRDLNPRVGVSYDVFGNGRTAVKTSLGRYVAKTNVDVAKLLNPIATSVNSASRAWTDGNQNYVPDCDLGSLAANGECGAISDQNFGKSNPNAVQWSDEVREGWGVRDYNWEFGTEIQHELSRGLSLTGGYYFNTGGYFRNTDSAQRVTNNLAVGPEDFDSFCITAPLDPRLPGGGGYPICGLSNVKPEKFGQAQTLVEAVSNFGEDIRRNHFFGVGLNARLAKGIRVGGGVDAGRSVKDQCFVVDSPGLTTFVPGAVFGAGYNNASFGPQTTTTIDGKQTCRIVTPIKAQLQIKLNGSVPLPKGFAVSGVFQDGSGMPIEAVYAAPTADVVASLGRNLAGGARTINVPLIAPQSLYEGRIRRLDLRLTKHFQLSSRLHIQVNLDAYNALNSSAVQSINQTFGASWLTPTAILDPRILQFSGQLNF